MLKKHSRDIIFIVIILILIGIIWGVEKNIWILIAINVVVIMVGLLYVNYNDIGGIEEESSNKKQSKENHYFTLKNIAESEIDEFLNEVDYDDFESVKKGKEILDKFSIHDDIGGTFNKIKKLCSYDIEVYYLGLVAISMANIGQLKERDYDYIKLGVKLVSSSHKLKTGLIEFIKNNGF